MSGEGEEGQLSPENSPVRSHIFQVAKVSVEDGSVRVIEFLYRGTIPNFILTELSSTGHVWERGRDTRSVTYSV